MRTIGTDWSKTWPKKIVEIKNIENDTWECLTKPARRVKVGTKVVFGNGKLILTCTKVAEEGIRYFDFSYKGIFLEVLDELGTGKTSYSKRIEYTHNYYFKQLIITS